MASEDKETYRRTWEDRLRGFDKDFNSWASSRVSSDKNVQELKNQRSNLDTRMSQMGDVADNQWEGFKKETESAWNKMKSDFNRAKPKL